MPRTTTDYWISPNEPPVVYECHERLTDLAEHALHSEAYSILSILHHTPELIENNDLEAFKQGINSLITKIDSAIRGNDITTEPVATHRANTYFCYRLRQHLNWLFSNRVMKV